jgi:hypothetical protein
MGEKSVHNMPESENPTDIPFFLAYLGFNHTNAENASGKRRESVLKAHKHAAIDWN